MLTKDQWWINKQDTVQQCNQIVSKIKTHMNTESNTASGSVASAKVSSITSARPEDSWQCLIFNGLQKGETMKNAIVLDSGSSIDLFCNQDWLKNKGDLKTPKNLHTNAGGLQVTKQAEPPNTEWCPSTPKP